jgi:ferric-dicitrate binding protein FerR (iron transport regulator)
MTRDDDVSKDAYNAKAAERMRKWRQSNKEHNSAYQKAYRAANREKLNGQQLICKARRK